jgi:hypothetical protein
MRIAACFWCLFGALLVVLATLLLLRHGRVDEATVAFRRLSPAYNGRPAQPRGLRQQELFGINPDRLILYAPMPADTGVLAIPQR